MNKGLAAWLLAAAGCALQGDRGRDGCPEDEMCSDATPDGLFFLGSQLADQPLGRMAPLPTAVGGSQRIRVVTGASSGSPAFALPFVAASAGSELAVGSVAPPEVTVLGLAEGETYLRIVEPGTNLLYDRIALRVEPIARAELRPLGHVLPGSDDDFAADPAAAWALLAGGQETIVVRLHDAAGERMADERLSLGVGAGLTAMAQESWDTLRVGASSPGDRTLVVRGGDNAVRDGVVSVVATVEDIVSVAAAGAAAGTDTPGAAGMDVSYCFRATSGGVLVAGAAFTFTATGGATTRPGAAPNCVVVQSPIPQAVTLTVSAGTVTREFSLAFLASATPATTARRGGPAAAPGERAGR
jgi:hypothetical protein